MFLNCIKFLISLSRLKSISYFFSSSTFIIRKPDEVNIGFENSPIFKFEILSLIFSFKLSSFTHPIYPPTDAESETLCIKAAFLKLVNSISLRIFPYFFSNSDFFETLKIISEIDNYLKFFFGFFKTSDLLFSLSIDILELYF